MEYSPELAVLRLLCRDRKYLDKYREIVYPLIKEQHIKLIYTTIETYYNTLGEHSYISLDELKSTLTINYSTYKDINILLSIVDSIYSLDISDSLANNVVERLIERDYANTIINKLLPVITENKYGILTSVEDELTAFNKYIERKQKESPFVEDDIEDIMKELVEEEGGLRWKLQCLQDDLGSLCGGVLGHIFARPNTGKTSFLACEVTNFARQLGPDENIIWFNNEERGRKVKARLYNAMLGATSDAIWRDVARAKTEFQRRNGTAIRLFDSGIITFGDLRDVIKEYSPKLIVIDQADKVHFKGMTGMEIPIRLKELYKHYRELAKETDIPIITVGQASADADGKKWIRPEWMDYSKTGKYAEMDFIIGIGKTHEEGEAALRFLNISKNKMKGIERGHTVKFDHETARFLDL